MAALQTLVVGAVLLTWTVLVVGSGPTLRVLGELCVGTYLAAVGWVWVATVTGCAWSRGAAPGRPPLLVAPVRSALFWQAAALVLLAVLGTAPLDGRAALLAGGGLASIMLVGVAATGLAGREPRLLFHPRVVAVLAPVVLYLALWALWAASRDWSAPWVELHFTAALTAGLAVAGLFLARRVREPADDDAAAPRAPPAAAGWAFMPLTLPAMAVVALRGLPAGLVWRDVLATHGQVALLFLAALPALLPAALIVAWGVDGLRRKRGGAVLAGLAAGALAALVVLDPRSVWALYGIADGGAGIPVDGLVRAAAAMLAACAGASALHLRRLGRSGVPPSLTGLVVSVLALGAGATLLIPPLGPSGAAWAAGAAASAGALFDLSRPGRG